MAYAIKNLSGKYWCGNMWGPVQACEEYEEIDDLPFWLEEGEDLYLIETHSLPSEGSLDIRYSIVDGGDDGGDASVVEI